MNIEHFDYIIGSLKGVNPHHSKKM